MEKKKRKRAIRAVWGMFAKARITGNDRSFTTIFFSRNRCPSLQLFALSIAFVKLYQDCHDQFLR